MKREEKHLVERALKQVSERNIGLRDVFNFSISMRERARITDKTGSRMWVIHADKLIVRNWLDKQRLVHASYLCGQSEDRDWAVRVPGTITTVEKALHWIIPAAVHKAIATKKKVLRQGDIYFVPIGGYTNNLWALSGTNHEIEGPKIKFRYYWAAMSPISVKHHQHGELKLDGDSCWRAYRQKQLGDENSVVGAD